MNNFVRRVVTGVGTLAMISTFAVLGASAASAEVDTVRGTWITVHVAHHGSFVQDITVLTNDGNPGTLRAFVGSFRAIRANDDAHRFPVGRDFPGVRYACGGLDRSGRVIENVCVDIT